MPELASVRRLLADAATWAALAPATLFFMGWARTRAYQHALGLYDSAAMPAAWSVMIVGLKVLVGPAIGIVLVYIGAWAYFSWNSKKLLTPFTVSELPMLAWITGGVWGAALMSLLEISDFTTRLVGDFTLLDLILTIVGAALIATLVVVPLSKGPFSSLILGSTLSGTLILALMLLWGSSVYADNVGFVQGNDKADLCTDFTAVAFDAPDLGLEVANFSYSNWTTGFLLITHQNGHYFVRNFTDNATLGSHVWGISEANVRAVSYLRLWPQATCHR